VRITAARSHDAYAVEVRTTVTLDDDTLVVIGRLEDEELVRRQRRGA